MTTQPAAAAAATSPPRFKCVCCKKKSFKTAEALSNHQQARAHHPVACPLCSKEFCDKHAVQQHQQVHQRKAAAALAKPQATTTTTTTTSPTSEPTLQQQSTATISKQQANPPPTPTPSLELPKTTPHPSTLHPLEQDLLYKYLLSRCHPRARLRAQNYPTASQTPGRNYQPTPPANPTQPKRRAIVLTCETDPQATGLTHLTATDFLSSEALLHLAVGPAAEEVQSRCTDKSTRATAADADAARTALWEVVDADTVLVGYGLQRGLQLLRMVHERVVDAGILTAEAVFLERSTVPIRRVWGLGELCGEVLGWGGRREEEQAAAAAAAAAAATSKKGKQRKKGTCDGWEECVAAREVVVWCLRNPELLRAWAEGKAGGDLGEAPQTSETAKSKRGKKKGKKKSKSKSKSKSKKRKQTEQQTEETTILNTAPPEPETVPTPEQTPPAPPPPQPEEPDEDEESDEGLEIVQWQDLE
ncbi:uncharacterized protein BO66DRAFT_159401 [Aspergillus aculeatinus CBS 121060]|uniref:Uncharacterized protein n=1 Tax=Aspergillus aculeatinus CBS 121060 TaxID=1448322 RepID=A0ACD1H0U7_9EURO|nr:hypothetical protein BO66DRAFT_159401 [Aspergillus aculeatinus CBS 121060]RAH67167.1 hypothetical protein BO66DRAFT_159401 [Aspergillus aculeatinus CBS 121060]